MKSTVIFCLLFSSLFILGCASNSGMKETGEEATAMESTAMESTAMESTAKTADERTAYEGTTGSGLLMERYKAGRIQGYRN